nr:hypothetical protein [Tanacetum cinerariifolium]
KEVDELKAERLAKIQDPLALMENSNNPYAFSYAGQNAGNPAGYNDIIGNLVISNAAQNPIVQNVGNQNGLIGVQGNGIQNPIENGNLVAQLTKINRHSVIITCDNQCQILKTSHIPQLQ